MTILEIKTFQFDTQQQETEAFLKNSMPGLSQVFKKQVKENILPTFIAARVMSDIPELPLHLKELSLVGFGVLRLKGSTRNDALLTMSYTSHSGIRLNPQDALADSHTGGRIYGTKWIEKFYTQYETPISSDTKSVMYGALVPDEELHLEHFTKAFNDMVTAGPVAAMAHIERAFGI